MVAESMDAMVFLLVIIYHMFFREYPQWRHNYSYDNSLHTYNYNFPDLHNL